MEESAIINIEFETTEDGFIRVSVEGDNLDLTDISKKRIAEWERAVHDIVYESLKQDVEKLF